MMLTPASLKGWCAYICICVCVCVWGPGEGVVRYTLLTSMLCSMLFSLSGVPEEKRSLIMQKGKMTMDEDPEVLVKGETEILLINNSLTP